MALIYTLTMEFMIHSKLQAYGTFLLFGGVNLAGFFFFLLLVKETKGLSDKEKKLLYLVQSKKILSATELEMAEKWSALRAE